MLLAAFVVCAAAVASLFLAVLTPLPLHYELKAGFYDPIRSAISKPYSPSPSENLSWVREMEVLQAENVEAALLRTCQVLYVLEARRGCADPPTAADVWGFAGTPGTVTALASIYSSVASSAFGCGAVAFAYGRYRFRLALPQVYATGFSADLRGVPGTSDEPCLYGEVARR
ncbi:hypothetical protein [Thermosulfurimonas sp. F29]|uniref:hypothetical protein n=1 Tax=Thermosulfurimonas sp. F29 TaxID=2867247 RepID=UPI001C8299C6|nr:hypothetical protein [Thermosulfurimonas sp. F29]MBX6424108.1 hypothetical protein [Thermosulfurimonas sp. F29]